MLISITFFIIFYNSLRICASIGASNRTITLSSTNLVIIEINLASTILLLLLLLILVFIVVGLSLLLLL